MIFEFSHCQLDVDIEKTKSYYDNANLIIEDCSCSGCRNYEKAMDGLPSEAFAFFAQFGIEMKKAREVYVNCANADDSIFYGGFYHICGTLIHGQGIWVDITSNFKVSFTDKCELLDSCFPLPAIQLDISVDLPWVLPERHEYSKNQS